MLTLEGKGNEDVKVKLPKGWKRLGRGITLKSGDKMWFPLEERFLPVDRELHDTAVSNMFICVIRRGA